MIYAIASKSGKFLEASEKVVPALLATFALSGTFLYLNSRYIAKRPYTLDPEFVLESQKLGNVSPRIEVAPVYRNPISNHIPGYILGPDDLDKA